MQALRYDSGSLSDFSRTPGVDPRLGLGAEYFIIVGRYGSYGVGSDFKSIPDCLQCQLTSFHSLCGYLH